MSGELRIILLVLGLALILLVYFKTRFDAKKKPAASEKRVADPMIYLKGINAANEGVESERAAPEREVAAPNAPDEMPERETAASETAAATPEATAFNATPAVVAGGENHRVDDDEANEDMPAIVAQRPQDTPVTPPQSEEPPTEPESPPPQASAEMPPESPPPPREVLEEMPDSAREASEAMPEEMPERAREASEATPEETPESAREAPEATPEETPESAREMPERMPNAAQEPEPDSPPATPASETKEAVGGLGDRLRGHLKKGLNGALNKIFQPDSAASEEENDAQPDEDARLLVLHIRAPSDRVFYGREVLFAADKVGLQRGGDGEKGTFEKVMVDELGARRIRFYMADMFEPGVFKWATFDETRVRGLSLFTRLSDQREAVSLFDEMVACARNVTALLEGAALLDEKHSTLTNQTISHMRDSLREEANKSHLTGA